MKMNISIACILIASTLSFGMDPSVKSFKKATYVDINGNEIVDMLDFLVIEVMNETAGPVFIHFNQHVDTYFQHYACKTWGNSAFIYYATPHTMGSLEDEERSHYLKHDPTLIKHNSTKLSCTYNTLTQELPENGAVAYINPGGGHIRVTPEYVRVELRTKDAKLKKVKSLSEVLDGTYWGKQFSSEHFFLKFGRKQIGETFCPLIEIKYTK